MARLAEGLQGGAQSLKINLQWDEQLEQNARNLDRLHSFREGTPSGHPPAFPALLWPQVGGQRQG